MSAPRGADLDQLCITTIRTLAMDAVQQANSGHPGTPMAMAPVAYVLYERLLRHNPGNPAWPNRDRFVLSMGHASMLLYSMLHLTGYEVSLDDIEHFRQLHSRCAGHPELHLCPGVETTTGPLGQGVATSVGMAIAERWLAATFNRPGHEIVDYRVFALAGDGCMMEGISGEAASLAGHLGLSNLVWIYDNNHITIEGNTALAFSEDVATRFLAYHWNVLRVGDANDLGFLTSALECAERETQRPTLVIVDSHIAYGSPHKQDTSGAHGEPLGEDEIRATKERYGWNPDWHFHVPDEVRAAMGEARTRGREREAEWQARFEAYATAHPELARQWKLMHARGLPPGWDAEVPSFAPDGKGVAGRDANAKVLNAVAGKVPWLVGGSADLTPSTKTRLTDGGDFAAGSYGGRNLHFGIREHGMSAILNGMALSGLRPFGSGFLIFSDYARPAIRLAAIMEQPVVFIFTHDSIGVGEDGPTHQPIEQLPSLRAIPHLVVLRPADANEVAVAWRCIMEDLTKRPVALVLSRQPLPTLDRSRYAPAEGLRRGGYVLADDGGTPQVILMGTGSEIQLCLGAYEALKLEGVRARVVNLPSWELFEEQPAEYRAQVLPRSVRARVAVEAATAFGWRRYVGLDGAVIARRDFGASAPLKELLKEFGFTVEKVVEAARGVMRGGAG